MSNSERLGYYLIGIVSRSESFLTLCPRASHPRRPKVSRGHTTPGRRTRSPCRLAPLDLTGHTAFPNILAPAAQFLFTVFEKIARAGERELFFLICCFAVAQFF